MILCEETFQKFGYYPHDVGQNSKKIIVAKCDCCNNIFNQKIINITMCRRNSKSEIDVCSNQHCINWKRNNTMMKKFGVLNAGQSSELREKIKKTCMKRFGVDNPWKAKIIREKMKSTNIKKYGVENPFQSEEIKDKIKATNLKKYGVEYVSQSPQILEKINKMFLEKWGGRSGPKIVNKIIETHKFRYGGIGLSSPEIHEKIRNTTIERYGTEFPMKNEEFKNKMVNNNIEKYGKHYFQTDEFKTLRKETNIRKYGKENPILDYSRLSRGRVSKFQKEVYSYILSIDLNSKMEKEISNEITSDIYIPSKNTIIECYGDYWHCNPNKYNGDFFHKNLKLTASDKWEIDKNRIEKIKQLGYNVIILWESEWNNNKIINLNPSHT